MGLEKQYCTSTENAETAGQQGSASSWMALAGEAAKRI
jgi:hypothetical protein